MQPFCVVKFTHSRKLAPNFLGGKQKAEQPHFCKLINLLDKSHHVVKFLKEIALESVRLKGLSCLPFVTF